MSCAKPVVGSVVTLQFRFFVIDVQDGNTVRIPASPTTVDVAVEKPDGADVEVDAGVAASWNRSEHHLKGLPLLRQSYVFVLAQIVLRTVRFGNSETHGPRGARARTEHHQVVMVRLDRRGSVQLDVPRGLCRCVLNLDAHEVGLRRSDREVRRVSAGGAQRPGAARQCPSLRNGRNRV